jgi:hypothetical protein
LNRPFQQVLGLSGVRKLTATDIDNVRALFNGAVDCSRQRELGYLFPTVGKNRNQQTSARRCDALHWALMLRENDARYMCAMGSHWTAKRFFSIRFSDLDKVHTLK